MTREGDDLDEWTRAMRAREYDRAVAVAEREGNAIQLVVALYTVGRSHDDASRDQAAEVALMRAIEVADSRLASNWRLRIAARLHASVYLSRKNRYPEALGVLREAVAFGETALPPDDPYLGELLLILGQRMIEAESYVTDAVAQARPVLERAISITEGELREEARKLLAASHRYRTRAPRPA